LFNVYAWQVIGQKHIGIRLAELSETSNRVTFNIIDTNNWFTHLILDTDFLLKNDLSLTLKKKAKDNLKLINEVASADIIKIDDFPITLSEIKTDFGHDVDKRTYDIVKEAYDEPVKKQEKLEPVTVSLKDNSIFAYAARKFAWTERL